MKQFETAIRPNSNANFLFETGSHALEACVQVNGDTSRPNYKTGYAKEAGRLTLQLEPSIR